MSEYRQLVAQFYEQGYALVRIDEYLVNEANDAFGVLIQRFRDNPASFCACRKGEEGDPDIGMIYRPGVGPNSDWKHFFHFSSDFFHYLMSDDTEVMEALSMLSELYSVLNIRAYEFAEMLAERKIISSAIAGSVLAKIFDPSAYSATVLRGLWYPKGREQKGARMHIDRSLFSMHLGDEGGQLLALVCEEDAKEIPISPPSGYAVVFPGVKMCIATEGRIRPLRHKSIVEPEQERRAMVQFVQADVGVLVKNSQAAYDAFFQQPAERVH